MVVLHPILELVVRPSIKGPIHLLSATLLVTVLILFLAGSFTQSGFIYIWLQTMPSPIGLSPKRVIFISIYHHTSLQFKHLPKQFTTVHRKKKFTNQLSQAPDFQFNEPIFPTRYFIRYQKHKRDYEWTTHPDLNSSLTRTEKNLSAKSSVKKI